jgi:hypothetical protein
MPVLDIVAERHEPDLGGLEHHFGRAQKAGCVVDDADCGERRGLRGAPRPDIKRIERRNRTRQKRGGPIVRGRGPRDQHRLDARGGERNRGGQTRRPATDHRDFNSLAFHSPYLTARTPKNDRFHVPRGLR